MAAGFFAVLLLSSFLPDLSAAETPHRVQVSSLLPSPACSSSRDRSALTVVHRHGPCSPFPAAKASPRRVLQRDRVRASDLQARVSAHRQRARVQDSAAESTLPTRHGLSLNTANYVVTVGFGTPKTDMSIIFDTGSDLTWIQCQPCATYCHSQQESIFDPSQSSSYRNISCDAVECSQLNSATGSPGSCSSSTCVYGITYGDSSYSAGFLGSETLTLTPSDSVSGFLFGCGEDNNGLFGETAGLLGLGRDRISLVSQTAEKFGRVFSYCLPSKSSSTGYLSFGGKTSNGTKFTSILTGNPPSFYFLNIVGLTLGGQRLPISASVFSKAGTVIDSGTVITRLPPAAYSALRSAFRRQMAKYPTAPALSILDTCYDLKNYTRVTVPRIGLQLDGGTELDVAFSGILYSSGAAQVCLAFAGNSDALDVAILGNVQQRTYEVVYDIGNNKVGFRPGGCS